MDSHNLLHTLKLSNGLTVSIHDYTKVYFGDYHHVRLTITCTIDTTADDKKPCCLKNTDLQPIAYTRTLEKMGVSSGDIETATKGLLNDFTLTALPYISSREFPKKMFLKQLSSKKCLDRKYLGSGS